MKIESNKPKFKPVTITFETKEEFSLLYHLLNTSSNDSFVEYCDNNHLDFSDGTKNKMANALFIYWEENDIGEGLI